MSNREGKGRYNTQKYNPGKACPRCNKGNLERTCGLKPGHEHHVMCKTCKYTNF